MDAREKQIAPPLSWETFEDLCLGLFKAIWRDPLAQKNGRAGQLQHGVDVFGSVDGSGIRFSGVQCKGKDATLGAKVSIAELERELAKAEDFEPGLSHWVLATTAATDAPLQEAARKLSAGRVAQGLFPIAVLGWGDIRTLLLEQREVLERFYPEVAHDLPWLLTHLRSAVERSGARELRQQLAELETGSPARRARWVPVTFAQARDLGPALMGRPLGPADVGACPMLPEALTAAAELERAYFARLEGEPGTGKSVCALQAARILASRGWAVFRLTEPRVERIDWLAGEPRALYLIDDAHLTPEDALRLAEDEAGPCRMLLSTRNAVAGGGSGRGAIVMDGKRGVRAIAAGLRADMSRTLYAVRRADDRVGELPLDEPLDRRLQEAEAEADRPWQFCFILGGGWRRAGNATDAARAARAHLALATVAIHQMVSRDARPSRNDLRRFHEAAEPPAAGLDQALQWLFQERLVIGAGDLRTPHQRFASIVLGRILSACDDEDRGAIGRLLSAAVADPNHPLAGIRLLLGELRFTGSFQRWTHLVGQAAVACAAERCWAANRPEERTAAMGLLSELKSYLPGWPHSVLESRRAILAEWFSDPSHPSGYGIGQLVNAVCAADRRLAEDLVIQTDPARVAAAISGATQGTAASLARMVALANQAMPVGWTAQVAAALDRDALLSQGSNWPMADPVWPYAALCNAVAAISPDLGWAMVDAFLPAAGRALASDPVTAIGELDDIVSHTLAALDPLGIYKGRHAPNREQRRLASRLSGYLDPARLARQLSAAPKRDFQAVANVLAFLQAASPPRYRRTVGTLDWGRLETTIGDDWACMFHDAEVLLGVCFAGDREAVRNAIERNAGRIRILPPRLAAMAPEVAVRHVEQGRDIGLSSFDHVQWELGAWLVAHFALSRPDLLDQFLMPAEAAAARSWSQQHPSWYRGSAPFVRVLRQFAPGSLDRILARIDSDGAATGWPAALSAGREARSTAALLVKSALARQDAIGSIAQRLRKRFTRCSVPRPGDVEPLSPSLRG